VKSLTYFLIAMCLISCAFCADGPGGPSGSSDGGSSSSSHGGKKIVKLDLDDLVGNFEKWKKEDPKQFDYMKKLLHIPFEPSEDYNTPTVYIYYPYNNTNITRNEKLKMTAWVKNNNPIEVRSNIYLQLEAKGPGEENFSAVSSQRVILSNEYSEDSNVSMRDWTDITPFLDSKETGDVSFRIWFNDMHNTHYTDTMYGEPYRSGNFYSELNLNLINTPPEIDENCTNVSPDPARYNDPIKYEACFFDSEGDMVNVTLHVFDELGNEHKNATQIIKSGKNVTFTASEYGFFGEDDAGKNFSYSYSYDDGLNGSVTKNMTGPSLLSSPKIYVSNPNVVSEDDNRYWWQSYAFSIKVKNPELDNLRIDLYTDTQAHPKNHQACQMINASDEAEDVSFDLKPFEVSDANQTFTYYFTYSAPDQASRLESDHEKGGVINPRLVKYSMDSGVMVANYLFILLISLVAGVVIERRLYR